MSRLIDLGLLSVNSYCPHYKRLTSINCVRIPLILLIGRRDVYRLSGR